MFRNRFSVGAVVLAGFAALGFATVPAMAGDSYRGDRHGGRVVYRGDDCSPRSGVSVSLRVDGRHDYRDHRAHRGERRHIHRGHRWVNRRSRYDCR